MAGTIPLSMTQQFDVYGKPLAGGQLYIIQAGTVSTPQDAFADINLTIKMPYPMSLDAAGRVPAFMLADGYVKIRLQDKAGVVQLSADQVLVIGPSAGGGPGTATVDPNSVMQTGNIILRYGVGPFAGYVRLNGLTIGNQGAIPSATERGNADCQALFLYLWAADTALVIVGGRGASASADWTAGKTLTLPDWRGYAFGCLDDMGNTPAGRISATWWGGNPILLGSVGGGESAALSSINQVPLHAHANTASQSAHSHSMTIYTDSGVHGGSTFNAYTAYAAGAPSNIGTISTDNATPGITMSNANAGLASPSPFRTIGPRKLCTGYMRL